MIVFNKMNINRLSLKKSIVRVTLALLLTVAILAIYMQISVHMTRGKMEDYAELESQQKASNLNTITNMIFVSNEWVVNSFLAGIANMSFQYDTVYKDVVSKYICEDDAIKEMNINDVNNKLKSFIGYNNEFYSAALIFEPGVIKDAPNGVVAVAYSHDSVEQCINIDNAFFNSGLYKSVIGSGRVIIESGKNSSDSLRILTTALPLYNEEDMLIGEFWLDIETDFYSYMLETYQLDKDVVSAIIDDDCRIISCVNTKYNGCNLADVIVKEPEYQIFNNWLNDLKSHIMIGKSHFSNKINDETYVTYVFPIRNTTLNLMVIKSEKKIYSAVKHFTFVSIGIMIVSILLISLCLIYIFFVFKRNNDQNRRMENELDVASDIQRRILPPNPQNNDNQQFDIYGFQRPAKSVGGDLYDFVQKGDMLHFCVGDVSGKGMPSALVMAELCSLYRYIICYHSDPQEIVTLINKAVMERSDDSMFCTLFVGVLNLKTGLLEFCNAGHNPPIFICHANSDVNYLKITPNMPIYAFENYCYQKESLQMSRGDRLFVYTDGVTEARNKDNRFYGDEATLSIVKKLKDKPFETMVSGVLASLKSFTRRAEQNDDITILCVEYKGYDPTHHLHFGSVKNEVVAIVDALIETCQASSDMRLRLALEEAVQNVADYAYPEDGYLDVNIEKMDGFLCITLCDGGTPFNPLEVEKPKFDLPIEQRDLGGLGIHFVRNIMDDITYKFENQQNKLTLKYRIK